MLGLVTADVAAPLDPDLRPFEAACRVHFDDGVRIVSWDDPDVDWTMFDAIVIRSTWDYAERIAEFREWIDRVDGSTRLVNSADAVRWSIDKHYLADLGSAGIPIVPTTFVGPGDPVPDVDGVHVVKPAIGAGSNGARRCESHEVAPYVAELAATGRIAMVQRYLDLLDERGETALCFVPSVGGTGLEFSHAFGKAAILTSTEVEQKGGLFAKEEITARSPTADELEIARAVFDTPIVRSFDDVAFARVDIVPIRDESGADSLAIMELELVEPSFYLETAPAAANAFAERLQRRLERPVSCSEVS